MKGIYKLTFPNGKVYIGQSIYQLKIETSIRIETRNTTKTYK